MHRVKCSEIWGGIKNENLDVCTTGLCASLFSSACNGGRGGDSYYFSVCGSNQLTRLALADVSGHGEQVGNMSQWVYEQVATSMNDLDQPGMMSALSDRVIERGYTAMTTAVIVSYYLENNTLYFSYAGHPPMLSRHGSANWREVQLAPQDSPRNLPLGVLPGIGYDMGELQYRRGDRLVLYTDGVIEAPSPGRGLFGVDRLRAALEEAGSAEPMEIKLHILRRLHEWTGGSMRHDDVTLIAIQLE